MAKNKPLANKSVASTATLAAPPRAAIQSAIPEIEFSIRNNRIVLGVITVCCFIAYIPGFDNTFVWDDMIYIVNNEYLKHFTLANFLSIWSIPDGYVLGNYHPLTITTNFIEYALVGEKAWLYHFDNLILHIFNSIFVYQISQKLSKNFLVGAVTGILFAVHPLHVESVVWAAERKDVLYTFFLLLSFKRYLQYTDELKAGEDWNFKSKHFWIALLYFVLSCLSKAMAVILPLVFIITDYFLLNRKSIIKIGLEKAPFFAVSLATGIMSIIVQRSAGADATQVLRDAYTGTERFFIINFGMLQYWLKMVIPAGLLPFYPYPQKPDGALPNEFFGAFFVIIAIAGTIYWLGRSNKLVWWGGLYFLIVIFPVSQVLPVGSAIAADRYFYVSSVGPLLLMGLLANYLYHYGSSLVRQSLPTLAGIVLLGFTFLSFRQATMWKDPLSLFPKVLDKYPGDPLMLSNMAFYYYQQKMYDQSIVYFEATHTANYKTTDSHVALGQMYFDKQQYAKCVENFEAAIKLKPKAMENLHWELATAYFYTNEFDKAEKEANYAISISKLNPFAINVLGLLKNKKGDLAGAKALYEQALKLTDKFQDPLVNLSAIYNQQGDHAKEIEVLEKAIKMKDKKTTAYKNLGVAYKAIGQLPKAIEIWKKGSAIDPADGSFDYNIGLEYGNLGNFNDGFKYIVQGYEKNDTGANQFLAQPQYQQMMQQFPETYQKFVKIAQQRAAAQAAPAPQPQSQVPTAGQPVIAPSFGQK